MGDGINEATAAFQTSIGGAAPMETADNTPERIGHGGALIDDGEAAGGDDIDDNDDPRDPEVEGGEHDPEDPDGDGDGDDEAGEDGEDGSDEEASGSFDPEAEVTVTVDGQEQTVKLGEAVKGYIRQETFHQRLNQLNEYQGALRNETNVLIDQRKQAGTMLEELQSYMEGLMPTEPDWAKLFAEDPAEARKLQVSYEGYKARLDDIKAKRVELTQQMAAEQQKRTSEYAQSEFGKFLSSNKIADEKTMQKELQSMRRTALNAGFKEEEIATVYDSRMLTLLRKASKYDRIMAASKPKPGQQQQQPGKRTLTPGAGKSNGRTAPTGNGNAMKRLSRTGSLDDASAVFAGILNRS